MKIITFNTPFTRQQVMILGLILALCSAVVSSLYAEESSAALSLQQEWDQANFGHPDQKQKTAALKALAEQARTEASQHPTDADVQIWTGIILSTYAGEAGMSALGLVKEAKKYFESAIALAPTALEGSAYTSLGSLYYQVPGWPIAFGDDGTAGELLIKGLELNPQGIDANYFYGDFLLSQKKYRDAAIYFDKALNAPAREGRELADSGRKQQAQDALGQIHEKLN